MNAEADAGRLLTHLNVLRNPSDLDLLIFFARHPRALLATEHLATFLGYDAKEIAASLELLLAAGLLSRTANVKHSARMYVLAVAPPDDVWLPGLRKLASTRDGRLALMSALRRRCEATDAKVQTRHGEKNAAARPLLFPKGRITAGDESRRSDGGPNPAPGNHRQRGGGERER